MVNTTTTDAVLIKDQVATMLVEPLEAASVVLAAGPTIFNSSEPLRIPRLTNSGTVEWVGEGEQIPDDYAATFDEIALMPTSRKSLKSITRVTNELIRAATIGVDKVLQQRLVHDVQTKLDDALLNGDGTNDSITGLTAQTGVQAGELDLTSADTFLDGLALASAEEVTPNRWFLNGQDFFKVRKLKDGNGRYILESDVTADTTYRLFGVPVTVTNKLAAGTAILADMSQVAVVRDLDAEVKILTELYAGTDETGIRVVTRYDLGLIRPEAVVKLTAAEG
ncbi:MAG: phage major capsid protein [Actinomycetia bacterium]|nr:phage major capsid protein [Actinomycetes bacterium]